MVMGKEETVRCILFMEDINVRLNMVYETQTKSTGEMNSTQYICSGIQNSFLHHFAQATTI